jgi:phosphohistidine phosphatase
MKTLLIMRHAKSSWKDPEIRDRERPLNKRGKKDAPMMGEMILEKKLAPDHILTSPAVRSIDTAKALASSMLFTGELEVVEGLYMAEVETIVEILRQVSDRFERILLIGHNPGLESLLQILSGKVESLPTCTLAALTLPINSWQDLKMDVEGELVAIFKPGDLKQKGKKEKDHPKEKEKEKQAKHKQKKDKQSKHK